MSASDEPTSGASSSPFPVLHAWDAPKTCEGLWDADLFIDKDGRLVVVLAQQVGAPSGAACLSRHQRLP
jgi:hypothetical protein